MKSKAAWLLIGIVAPCLSCADSARGDLIDFEDLGLGTRYFTDDEILSAGVNMTVSNGGHIDVQDLGDAGGSGNELEFFGGPGGGVSLSFDFGGDVDQLSLLYGAFGGGLNLTINGDGVIVGNFGDLPDTLGGVDIEVLEGGYGMGTIGFDGLISSFSIGGQEFVLDDVDFRLAPAPGIPAMLTVGFAFGARRRRRRNS